MWRSLGGVLDEYFEIPAIERKAQGLTPIDFLSQKMGDYHVSHPFWYCQLPQPYLTSSSKSKPLRSESSNDST